MICTQGIEKSRACHGASYVGCTLHRRGSIRLSSTTLQIHGLCYRSRRKSGIQVLRWIHPAISDNHTKRVVTPQKHQPLNMPNTRLYMSTKMATLTLQILCRAHETVHLGRSLKLDFSCRIWYQCGSSVHATPKRWSHQTMTYPERQISERRGWSQPYTPTKHWRTNGASCCSEILEQDWPSRRVQQFQNRRSLGTTLHLPHTYRILPQSHYATRRSKFSCHPGTSHVRNL